MEELVNFLRFKCPNSTAV